MDADLDLDAIFSAANNRMKKFADTDSFVAQDPETLLHHYEMLTSDDPITVGSLAMWKPGLRYRRFPAYGDPCVVLAVFDEPIVELIKAHDGQIVAMDVVSAEIGILDEDGDLETHLVDARRFKPWMGHS